MSREKLLFVYGTLKRGGSNHHFLNGQKFVADARTVPGFRLYALDGFPGLVTQPDDRAGVTGEVWSVASSALLPLDALEGLDEGLYRREPIPLLAPFAAQRVEAYLYARSIAGRRDLGSTWMKCYVPPRAPARRVNPPPTSTPASAPAAPS